ncbi:MAG: hypothetical protein V1859_11520 [archaeon]
MVFFCTYILTYFILVNRHYPLIENNLILLSYLGVFLAGIFYAYGFTSGPAVGVLLIISRHVNIFVAGLIGGLGSLLGDFLIFEFIRVGFEDEIKKLSHEHIFKSIDIPKIIKKGIMPLIAFVFIASPLPDEIGVSILAATKIPTKFFAIISYTLNTAGIFFILFLGIH